MMKSNYDLFVVIFVDNIDYKIIKLKKNDGY